MNHETTSKKTVKVFTFIQKYIKDNGWAPTVVEIRKGTDVPPSSIEEHLRHLVEENIIKRGTKTRQIAINPRDLWNK